MPAENLPPSRELDHCCDLFESRWNSGKAFSIEDVLSRIPAGQQAAYLRALLPLEIELRRKAGERVSIDELRTRFTGLHNIVTAVLRQLDMNRSLAAQETIAPQHSRQPAEDRAPQTEVKIPRQLGRYRMIRKLGQGAMGSVFLAHDEQLNRQVALKIPRLDLQQSAEMRVRFQREAQAAAALHHPNICPIFDIAEIDGIHFICMGYIEGASLSRFAVADSGLTEQRIAELVLKLANALATAHEAGFIHRDLKPANVMLDHNDEPVILDFGLARRIDRTDDPRVTQSGTTLGSPAYMSPEQVDGDQDRVDLRSDIYSLGVILYELLTGRLPFEGSLASVMGQIMTREPDKPSDFRQDLTVRLENLCLRMMAKDANKRHPSMHAVSAALQEYLDRHTIATTPVPAAASDQQRALTGQKRRDQIQKLITSGDYRQAEKLLVSLSRETDESQQEAATWAAAELPRLRKIREDVRAGRQEMYVTANRLMKTHDYEQAAQLLAEYPYDLRTPKMQQLLEVAEATGHEVQRLRREIKGLRQRGDNAGLVKALPELLELKPADRRAKELYEQLTRKSVGPISRSLGKRTPGFIDKLSASVQWIVLALGLLLCCYPAYTLSSGILKASSGGGGPSPVPSRHPSQREPTFSFPENAAFVKGTPLKNVNTFGGINAYPWISADGLTIWWTREGTAAASAIYQASRPTVHDEFGGARMVLSNTRTATISSDGLELIGRGTTLSTTVVARRQDIARPFSTPEPITALSEFSAAMCFGFNADNTRLTFQNRPAEALHVVHRPAVDQPWNAAPQLVTFAEGHVSSSVKVGWGQLLDEDRLLLHTRTEPDRNSQERATISKSMNDGLHFGDAVPISIDGQFDLNIRSPRYCEATGELFYTLCTGPLNKPGSAAEIWVATADDALNSEQTIGRMSQWSENRAADEWIDLFDGQSFRGWRILDNDPGISITNGHISIDTPKKSGTGIVTTGEPFSDFDLDFEYLLHPGGNSGVRLRIPDLPNLNLNGCLEIQLIDETAVQFNDIDVWQRHGAVYGVNGPATVAHRRPNQWYRMTVRAVGMNIVVSVDDREVCRADLYSDSIRSGTPHIRRSTGLIGFSGIGPVEIRNIRIKRLQPSPRAVGVGL